MLFPLAILAVSLCRALAAKDLPSCQVYSENQCASPWVAHAQALIGAVEDLQRVEGWKVTVGSRFVYLASSPPLGAFHLPFIAPDPRDPKAFAVTTYAQTTWDALDGTDFGAAPTSASELAAKMMSRQCVLIKGAHHLPNATPFSVDDPDFCAMANEAAYRWALTAASPEARSRFERTGVPYTFGPDAQRASGPTWIYTSLAFTPIDAPGGGRRTMQVTSAALKTSIDQPHVPGLPDVACYHYCKLLSPARAMEWIYVDGLRPRTGWGPPPRTTAAKGPAAAG